MNIENIVKGLECCTERDKCDKKCPYWNSDKSCWINLKKDALALLKEQERVEAITVEWIREKMRKPQMTEGNPFGFVLAEWLDEQEAQDG